MSTDLRAAILKALTGSDSQHPVNVAELYKLGSGAQVDALLHTLRDSGEINSVIVTKRGVTSSLFWLTGVINTHAFGSFVIGKHTQQDAAISRGVEKRSASTAPVEIKQQPEQNKEIVMTRITSPAKPRNGAIPDAVLRHVIANPGIDRAALLAAVGADYPAATAKKISKAIWDLINVRHALIQQWGYDGWQYFGNTPERAPHPNPDGTTSHSAKPQSAGQAAGYLPLAGEGANVKSDLESLEARQGDFSLMLSDDDSLYISLDDDVLRLNPAQVARLGKFITRVAAGVL